MNRTDLAAAVAEATRLSITEASAAVAATFDQIAAALGRGESVVVPGFGSFEVRERSARTGRNPQTGEPIQIAAGLSPAFKAAAALKRQVSASA